MANETAGIVGESMGYVRELFGSFATKAVVVVTIILVGFIVGRIAGRVLHRALEEIEINRIVEKGTDLAIDLAGILATTVSGIVYFMTVVAALNYLGITPLIVNIISVAAIVLFVVAAVLSFKDFLPNVMAGISVIANRTVNTGDRISVGNTTGTVKNVSLTHTEVVSPSGDVYVIPNASLVRMVVRRRRGSQRRGKG
ncbi:mechanosensitive ion channel [Candidatus Woesearchaeota archaeon]|nr:mechanosensitive ion channel [Candidatus Woesearchaeota archaeon]